MPPPHHMMRNEPEYAQDVVKTFRRLLGLLRGQRRQVCLLLPSLLIIMVTELAWPSILGDVIDTLAQAPVAWRRVIFLLVLSLVLHGIGLLARIHRELGTVRLSISSVVRMRRELFNHLLRLPVARYDQTRHGEFMSRLTNDTSMAGDTLGHGLLSFFASCFTLIGTFVYMLWLSVPMTFVACATLPLTYLAGQLLVRISRKLYRARQKALGELNGFAEEMIAGQHTVQAFSREEDASRTFNELSNRLKTLALRAEIVGGFMGPMMNMINNLSFILVAAVGGWLAIRSPDLTVGTVIAFLLYSRQFGRPVNEIAGQFAQIQSAIAGAERVFRMVDEPPEVDAGTQPLPTPVRGDVAFEHVDFRYVPDTPVLEDFSVTIPAGQKVALVGETGSGKTTIISLLARFYEPQAGCIRLDGVDIRDIPKARLRRNLAIVLQDVHLFSGTVAENISYGRGIIDPAAAETATPAGESAPAPERGAGAAKKAFEKLFPDVDGAVGDVAPETQRTIAGYLGEDAPGCTREQMIEAARLANADEFIRALPQGYDTPLNQTDTALSQGQCQLLSIARAALSDPAVLILDEATSSVDTRTEMHIQEAMLRLLKGRTSIVIAHRLSTVRDADTILVLDHGRIVGKGSHAELLETNAPYQRLVAASGSEDCDLAAL